MTNPIPPAGEARYIEQAARRILSLLGGEHDSPFMARSAYSLLEVAERQDHFAASTKSAKKYYEDMQDQVRQCSSKDKVPDYRVKDISFRIFENIALLFREDHLRNPTRQLSPAQAEHLRYFETCGEWQQGDGTEVSEQYHFVIPDEVARS